MKLAFLELPGHERRLYSEQAAVRRGLSAVVLEKDFWVCWLLGVLFRSTFRESLVFKGGTSLSKVFQVIDRFSEDIDLSVSPALLGLPEAGTSRNQADNMDDARRSGLCKCSTGAVPDGSRGRGERCSRQTRARGLVLSSQPTRPAARQTCSFTTRLTSRRALITCGVP